MQERQDGGFTPTPKSFGVSSRNKRGFTPTPKRRLLKSRAKGTNLRLVSGFSIVEIMVVISITILLSVLTLGYNRSSEKQILLFRDQTVVVSVLNRAKALAIEKFVEVGTGQATTTCAFGIRFSELTNSFSLYRDIHDAGCDDVIDYSYNSAEDGAFLDEFELDQRSSFNLFFDGGTETDEDVDIAFVSPHLEVFASHLFPITIEIESGGTTVKVDVSGSGQIITID